MNNISLSSFTDELSKYAGLKGFLGKLKDLWQPASKVQARQVERFFASQSPRKWDTFLSNVKTQGFLHQLAEHPLTDSTLLTHAQSMHNLVNGQPIAVIKSSSGQKYEIIRMLGGDLGCTCNDWRFKGSVLPGYECKHIRAYKAGEDKVS